MKSPLSASTELEAFFSLRQIPVFCNVLYDDAESARAADRGDLELGVCAKTGMIFNTAFDAQKLAYSPRYENSLHFSPRFRAWAEGVADQLAHAYLDASGEDLVVDVGCGQGDFLRTLATRHACRALGFDTSLEADTRERLESGAELALRAAYLDPDASELAPRLLLNRHVLEHVEDPIALLAGFRAVLSRSPGSQLYLEVPNALWTFEKLGVWDLIYEHCGYFAPCALHAALSRAGFRVQTIRREFGDQFLCAFATVAPEHETQIAVPPDEIAHVVELARGFGARFEAIVRTSNDKLEAALAGAARVVIWGAGSKGAMLLNLLPRASEVLCAVDKNPRKTGKFLAGSGHRVVAPDQLASYAPDVVLVANPLYRAEIEAECKMLGLGARVDVI